MRAEILKMFLTPFGAIVKLKKKYYKTTLLMCYKDTER